MREITNRCKALDFEQFGRMRMVRAVPLCLALFVSLVCLSGCSWGALAPQLSESEILDSVNVADVVGSDAPHGEWCSNETPAVVSKKLNGVEDLKFDDSWYKDAAITVECETSQFRILSDWVFRFELIEGHWQQVDGYQTGNSVEWVGGIPDDLLLSRATTFMQMVDNDPDSSKTDAQLLDLYKESFSAEVIENKTAQDGTAVLGVYAQQGLAKYQGALTVSFAWTGTDWQVDCSADKGAYQADYSPYEGVWTGSFVETAGWGGVNGQKGKCYASKEIPPKVTIKEVDPVSLTAKADFVFVIHGHEGWLYNDANTVEGDATIELEDVLITLEPDNRSAYKIVEKRYGDYSYTVYLENDDSGNLNLMVKVYDFLVVNVSDMYSLSKSEEA